MTTQPRPDKLVYSLAELESMSNPPWFYKREGILYGYRASHDMTPTMALRSLMTWNNDTILVSIHTLLSGYEIWLLYRV